MNKEGRLRIARQIVRSSENEDKDAINLLLEVAAQVDERITFNLSEELGLSFHSLFSCEVKLSLLPAPCKAFGANKRMAKLNAAEQAIEMLRKTEYVSSAIQLNLPGWLSPVRKKGIPSFSLGTSTWAKLAGIIQDTPQGSRAMQVPRTPAMAHSSSLLSSPGDWSPASSPTSSNPIGDLQEMAAAKHWDSPIYELKDQRGQSHDMTFVMRCKFNGLESDGKGRNKRTAKRLSAENMLHLIRERQAMGRRDNSMEKAGANSPFTSPRARSPELEPLPKALCTTKPSKLAGSSAPRPSFFSSALFDADPAGGGDTIDLRRLKLKSPLLVEEPLVTSHTVESLKERGHKDGFTVAFHDLDQAGCNGNRLCFVELSTSPSAVCCGSGVTQGAAHASAAHNALQYLDAVPAKS